MSSFPRDDGEGKWNVTHRHPAWTSDKLVLETDHPFSDMIIQDNAFLDKLEVRREGQFDFFL